MHCTSGCFSFDENPVSDDRSSYEPCQPARLPFFFDCSPSFSLRVFVAFPPISHETCERTWVIHYITRWRGHEVLDESHVYPCTEAYPYEIVQWFQLFLCIVLKKDYLYIFDFIYFEALYTNDR